MMDGIICCQNRVEKPFDENKKIMFIFICEGFSKDFTKIHIYMKEHQK